MTKELSPETSIQEIFVSHELPAFASDNEFDNIKEMLRPGFNELYTYEEFDYRLQCEIVTLVQNNHWEYLLELE